MCDRAFQVPSKNLMQVVVVTLQLQVSHTPVVKFLSHQGRVTSAYMYPIQHLYPAKRTRTRSILLNCKSRKLKRARCRSVAAKSGFAYVSAGLVPSGCHLNQITMALILYSVVVWSLRVLGGFILVRSQACCMSHTMPPSDLDEFWIV